MRYGLEMRQERSAIATRLSRILLVTAFIGACGSEGTSLDGLVPCSTGECTSGQLCVYYPGGLDAGVGPGGHTECAVVPDRCIVQDCEGIECDLCLRELCAPLIDGSQIRVSGRMMSCPGQ